jgi:hypothetical protein
MSVTEFDPTKVVSANTWKKNAVHAVTLPSTSVVKIRIPDLAALIEAGQIPQHLLDVALGAAAFEDEKKMPTVEDIILQRQFTDKIAELTVVEPKLTEADMADIPFEDKHMLTEFALRTRDLDALNHHIGGIDKIRRFLNGPEDGDDDTSVEGA